MTATPEVVDLVAVAGNDDEGEKTRFEYRPHAPLAQVARSPWL